MKFFFLCWVWSQKECYWHTIEWWCWIHAFSMYIVRPTSFVTCSFTINQIFLSSIPQLFYCIYDVFNFHFDFNMKLIINLLIYCKKRIKNLSIHMKEEIKNKLMKTNVKNILKFLIQHFTVNKFCSFLSIEM